MTDDLEQMKETLAADPPRPAPISERNRALEAAMAAFEAETDTAFQGSTDSPRQRVRQSGLMTQWRRAMDTLFSTRTVMMGGSSLAVLAVTMIALQTYAPDLGPLVAPEPASDKLLVPFNSGPIDAESAGDAVPLSDLAEAEVMTSPIAQPAPAPAESRLRAQMKIAPGRLEARRPEALQQQAARLGLSSGCAGGAAACSPQGGTPIAVPLREGDDQTSTPETENRDRFEEIEPNRIVLTSEQPVSTFSIDVDTASYSFMRQALSRGVLPPKNAIRVEELINYFPYGYTGPDSRDVPFATHVNLQPTPWNEQTRLIRIGIQGYALTSEEKPRSNLVFLLDTSGSMNSPDKLPLLIRSFEMLVTALNPDDTVSIVTYAGSAGTVLAPTPVSDRGAILSALQRLSAGGSTAGGEGIRQAYALAEQNFDEDGVNRVILATDGDFNVGISDPAQLQGFVERKRASGIFLSVLGFGRGNYNDALMQTLAQNGNGTAAYIDTLSEAQKVLVDEASSTLFPIAKDVKIQVEFNPAQVSDYRLIGYETRILNREDFNNDKVDAGEIGAGHSVTALYEITPVGAQAQVDPLRYQAAPTEAPSEASDEYAFLKIRYKEPEADESRLITRPITPSDVAAPDADARFAAAVAAFGQLLRGGRHTGDYSYDDVLDLANGSKGTDPFNYRGEFVQLVRQARTAAALDRP